ncbi:adenosylmethionine--8-amino-7-oxononanoate transaminase [Helicobacter sp. 11S02629-2]|uniref:adenosylmethionine--8-amino-7-oxononanoate transaminase n=1 Tax=Helicobacter sp. 11S02629-2 TaxID=1476195 RepID=UPI000BA75563|nr:adenosylmethionine--8-amino-7-oxononanoate transaminase [Helicobacter sp. 11S02629-2]PAF42884.1 adenosylmethionine--8-amino-7-oxononanoate transaminase [Helicobacter sp. 11S02629-2]
MTDISTNIWHPCSQEQMYIDKILPMLEVVRAKELYLYDKDSKAYMDCISSWWTNIFGHCNDYIAEALSAQTKTLDHVLLAGFNHPQILKLSTRLLELMPKNLGQVMTKCFYADNGSSAIEVALKLSFQKSYMEANCNPKKAKTKFLKLQDSYHGETLGALSVCDVGLYSKVYEPLLLDSIILPTPKDDDIESCLKALESILEKESTNICAFILEPLIQCAGGMKVLSASFIKRACEIVKSQGIDVIFDEIAVGFGRSGEMFALEEVGFMPDFLCLSKGITGGFLPLSVVLTNESVYKAFLGDMSRAFLHSHSYTGSALACACANATLDIFEKENVIEKNKILSKDILTLWKSLGELKSVSEVRAKGMIFALDSTLDTKTIYNEALKKGFLFRPLGSCIYLMPPYIITLDEAKKAITTLKDIMFNLEKEST